MYKLTFTLKQHTPLIHFQHMQDGATLRASEVKPKLDRFIIGKLKELRIEYKKWLVGKGDHEALDYKLKIEPNYNKDINIINDNSNAPMYFGNMGNESPPKHYKFVAKTMCLLISDNGDLCKMIFEHIAEFFFINNFGTRQNKGYGSYTVEKLKLNSEQWIEPQLSDKFYDYNIEFSIGSNIKDEELFTEPFRKIDWFYRSLRSGINYKGLYFKSALFMYLFYEKKIQWDKKTIKAQYLNNTNKTGLLEYSKRKEKNISFDIIYMASQNNIHNTPDILDKPIKQNPDLEFKLWRDLFGLSTDETWYSYRAAISKKEAFIDGAGKWKPKSKENLMIERFKSPLIFKPIINGDKMIVYFKVYDQLVLELLSKKLKMLVEIKHKDLKYWDSDKFKYDNSFQSLNNTSLVLPYPDSFSFSEFFNYSFNSIDINKHIKMPKNSTNELNEIKKNLIDIYGQLKNNMK